MVLMVDLKAALPAVRYDQLTAEFKSARPGLAARCAEFKALPCAETKADREKRRVEMWVATYGNVDLGDDLIELGAAQQTIEEDLPRRLIKFFWNHSFPIGPVEVLEEHERGLLLVGKVTNHPEFDRYLAQIEDGTASHGSIGYSVREYRIEKVDDKEVRVIENLRLFEGSAVIWPMNESAEIVGVRKEHVPHLELSPILEAVQGRRRAIEQRRITP